MTLVKEDGTGKVDANTYADVADGDVYHEGHLYATAWTAATTGNKEKALVFATRLIDAEYQFNGAKLTASQALQWPREDCPDPDRGRSNNGSQLSDGFLPSDAIPRAVVQATCELARELLIADRTAAPAGEGITAIWTETSGTKYCKTDTCPIISYVAQALLGKYGALLKSGIGMSKLVRC